MGEGLDTARAATLGRIGGVLEYHSYGTVSAEVALKRIRELYAVYEKERDAELERLNASATVI